MKLFDLDNRGNPIISPEVLVINAFYKLHERDTSRKKDNARKEFTYIYYFCDYRSNYSSLSDEERHIEALKDAGLPNKWKPDEDVKAAIARYKELSEDDSVKALKSAKLGLKKLSDYFESVDLTMLNARETPIYSAKDLAANIKSLGAVIAGIDTLEIQVKKRMSATNRAKGGAEKAAFEDSDNYKG